MYIIGRDVDEKYKLEITPPTRVSNTSEFCVDGDLFNIKLTVPSDDDKPKTFTIHLYSSNSASNPYISQVNNYWSNLVPTWRFYNEDKKIIFDLEITVDKYNQMTGTMSGSANFHYVDDMPSSIDAPIYIWATLNLDEFTKKSEIVKVKSEKYEPPVYANSVVIAVTTMTVNPVKPTKISITRNSKDLLSTGIYWSNQLIPFIATINSDHYADFREDSDVRCDLVDLASDIVYNYPNVSVTSAGEEIVEHISGNLGIQYTIPPATGIDGAIEKYLWYTRNRWDFFKDYLPPDNVMEASSTILDIAKTTSAYELSSMSGDKMQYIPKLDVLEVMDYPTYDDLVHEYSYVTAFFKSHCNKCSEPDYPYEGPDINYITLYDYQRLLKQHDDFNYMPYALRLADTLTVTGDAATGETWCNFSGYYTDEEVLDFRLLDLTSGYNYKIGGYSFGKTYCPDLSGENRTGKLKAVGKVNGSKVKKDCQYHLLKYAVIQDGRKLYLADERNAQTDEIRKQIINYLSENNLSTQAVPDQDLASGSDYVKLDPVEDPWLTQYGSTIGAACVAIDPLYNTWVADADTGYLYKFDITGKKTHSVNLVDALDEYVRLSTDMQLKKDWQDAKNATTSGEHDGMVCISPTHIVLDGKNNLYVTSFDQMMLLKLDGINGDIKNVWLYPDCIVRDEVGFEKNAGWKVVGVDTNEINEYAVLYQTRDSDNDEETHYQPITNKIKIAVFNEDDTENTIINLKELVPSFSSTGIRNTFLDHMEPYIDTSKILFRYEADPEDDKNTKKGKDHIYIAGVIQPTDETAPFAETFDETKTYRVGDVVTKDKNAYKCIVLHEQGECDDEHFSVIEHFSPHETYALNDYCIKDNKIYYCKQSNGHKGKWNAQHFSIKFQFMYSYYEFIWRYTIDKKDNSVSVTSIYGILSTTSTYPNGQPGFIPSIDSMFIDVDNRLWFIESRLNPMLWTTPMREFQYQNTPYITNIRMITNPNKYPQKHDVSVGNLSGTELYKNLMVMFTGISQASNQDIILLKTKIRPSDVSSPDRFEASICRYKVIDWSNNVQLQEVPNQVIDIPLYWKSTQPRPNDLATPFANGDWTGAEFLNKYTRSGDDIIETDDDESYVKLYAYERYYIRKHNEEWDVAEHAKIPVAHTSFPEDNPELFKTIGTTLGIDEHKHYSIGKKLFEGIANQVANIHDIDECHIDSIYDIANKEDVNIDKFILSYPEELRRIADIMSITRKKLWGDRCHCTQNYFKTKHPDDPRYCPKCRHSHKSNLGSAINPYDPFLWNLTKYRIKYGYAIIANKWNELKLIIPEMCGLFNSLFDMGYECPVLKRAKDSIEPVNKMLRVIQDELYLTIDFLDIHSTSYDVLRSLNVIHTVLMSIPNGYIIEDKFNRDQNYTRISISIPSYNEALEILDKINADEYLTDEEKEMMANGQTNDHIILQASVQNIIEEAINAEKTVDEMKNAQLLAIHTSFFTPDQWFNYCYWYLVPKPCHNLNTSVINWDSKYTTLPETDDETKKTWYFDPEDENSMGETGTMEKILNYILHNGTLFHRNNEYIDD